MPKLTKKEGLFLSRLQDQDGRLTVSGNTYDRLIKARPSQNAAASGRRSWLNLS
jgi:hypothetical protein